MVIPNLPDNISKLILIGGLLLTVFAYTQQSKAINLRNNIVDQQANLSDSVKLSRRAIEDKKKGILKKAQILALRNGIPNPLTVDSSGVVKMDRIISGDSKHVINIHDSIAAMYDL